MSKRIILSKPYRLNFIVMRWVESLASCAIEGNELGIEMMELWNNDKRDEFVRRLENEWQPELMEDYNEQRTDT